MGILRFTEERRARKLSNKFARDADELVSIGGRTHVSYDGSLWEVYDCVIEDGRFRRTQKIGEFADRNEPAKFRVFRSDPSLRVYVFARDDSRARDLPTLVKHLSDSRELIKLNRRPTENP
jgi:hypothetical protein